jgi:dienelactone hydrolase
MRREGASWTLLLGLLGALTLSLALAAAGGCEAGDDRAGGADAAATDAPAGDAVPDDGADAAAPDGGAADAAAADVLPDAPADALDDPPRPADPCGTDLDAPNGTVRPDYGDPAPGGAFSGDPGEPGPWAVWVANASVANPDPQRPALAATTWAPGADDGATPLDGPLPLVVVFPGFGIRHTAYPYLTEHLASHGFAVVAATPSGWSFAEPQDHPKSAAELRAVLDWALADGPLADRLDPGRVALAGHSAGGKLSFLAATEDPRPSVVIGWDPQNGGGPPCAIAQTMELDCNRWPVAPNCAIEDPGRLVDLRAETLVFAARDGALTPDAHLHAEHFYRGAPSPAHLVLLPAASHAAWVQAGEVSLLTRRVHTALLLTRLQGRTGLEVWLPGGADLAAAAAAAGGEIHTK